MLILDIKDKIDVIPGLTRKESVIHHYAVDILEEFMNVKKLIVFDEAERMGTVTENNLLIGFWDWDMYSNTGNSLVHTDDITMRLFDKKGLNQEELNKLTGGKDLLSLQADMLKEAARFLLNTLKEIGYEPVTVTA